MNSVINRPNPYGVGSGGGYAGDLTPQLFMWGYCYVYPLEKPNT